MVNGQAKRKDTKSLILEIFQQHPDWNARKIYDRYLVLISNSNNAVTLNAVQKHVQAFKAVRDTDEYQELEKPWHMGVLDDYSLPAEAIQYVLALKEWHLKAQKAGRPYSRFSILEAVWVGRLYRMVRSEIPLSDEKLVALEVIIRGYASYEALCKLAGTSVITTHLDEQLLGFCNWLNTPSSINDKENWFYIEYNRRIREQKKDGEK